MHETRMNDKRGEERTEIRSKRREVEGRMRRGDDRVLNKSCWRLKAM